MNDGDKQPDSLPPDLEELRRRIDELKSGRTPEPDELHGALAEVLRHRTEASAMLKGARAILKSREFENAAKEIFDVCKEITGSTAGYVALLNEDGSENEVLFLDAGGLPCTVDTSLPMPIRGLRAEAYRDGGTVYDNDFTGSGWMKLMPAGHMDLRNVMFAPLNLDGETVGLMGLANKPGDFTEDDARIASLLGEFAAIALQNSKYLDSLYKANDVLQRQVFERKQAEAALRESEEQFRGVYEQSPIGIEVYDAEGCLLEVNDACHDIFGVVESSELFGFRLFEDPNLPDESIKKLQRGNAVRYDAPFDFEIVKEHNLYQTKKSGLIHLDVLITPLRPDAKTSPTGYMVQVQDITARKRAQKSLQKAHAELERRVEERTRELARANADLKREIEEHKQVTEALRQSEARFSSFMEHLPGVAFIKDSETRHIFVNTGFEKIADIDAASARGRTNDDIFPPEIAESFNQIDMEVVESGKPITTTEAISSGDKKRTFMFVKFPIAGEVGKPPMVGGIALDITEQTKMAEKLRESEERYRDLVEGTEDLVTRLDAEGKFLFVNRASERIFGLEPEQCIGLPAFKFIHPEDQERTKKSFDEFILAKIHRGKFENRQINRNGEVRHMIWNSAFHYDDSGAIISVDGIGHDITELKEAEEERQRMERQIQHAQKLESLGVLAGGVAHDFNNLLTGILGNAQLAQLNLSPTSPAIRNIEEIEKASQRAAELSNQMLAYSGQGRFRIESIDLNEVLMDMTHLLEVSISNKVVLKYNLAGSLPPIRADVAQIRQVIMNLITNASEAIGDEIGAIAVTTGAMECDSADLANPYLTEKLEPGEYVRLEIADTGGGMDEEALNKLFDPFFTTKFMGRGLGLAATLGIIRGHNGAIKVDSEPGKGTTFRVLFPAHDKPAEMKTAGQAEAGPEEWRGVGVVLLVDDEETVRMVAGEMLEAMGFTVLTARDGAEAVKIFGERGGQIDLVLLDMSMPRMNGAEAFDQIRRLKPDARVILSSGFGVSEAMRRFDGKGLSGFIKKPYTYNALMEIVKEATGSR